MLKNKEINRSQLTNNHIGGDELEEHVVTTEPKPISVKKKLEQLKSNVNETDKLRIEP